MELVFPANAVHCRHAPFGLGGCGCPIALAGSNSGRGSLSGSATNRGNETNRPLPAAPLGKERLAQVAAFLSARQLGYRRRVFSPLHHVLSRGCFAALTVERAFQGQQYRAYDCHGVRLRGDNSRVHEADLA